MKIVLNDQGYVHGYATIGSFSTSSVDVNMPSDFEDFEQNYKSYYLSESGELVKNDDKQVELESHLHLAELRSQRDKVCFPVINRGELWYSKLTNEQKIELSDWYNAWLDVTDTLVAPEAPKWLF